MKKWLLSIISIFLVVCMLFTAFPVAATNVGSSTNSSNSFVEENMSIKSTNSIGAMIADAIGDEQEKQEENNGINIFSVEVEDKVATAEIETVMDAVLVVGIYSEDGIDMYASGKADIAKGDETAQVTIDIDTMPQYFYLKAYIIELESLKPLCTVYESPNYTQEMQEFFAKTVEDFEEKKVLNLDDDETNNFAVYNDEVKLIERTPDSANELVSTDDEQMVYVIENADESITSLQEGDIFSYSYDEENVIIVKVKSVTFEGTTATIVGDDAELNEIFDYFRVEEGADFINSNFDSTEMDDALETSEEHDKYNGKNSEPVGAAFIEGNQGATLSYNIDTDRKTANEDGIFHGSAKVKGSIELSLMGKVKIYVSLTYQHIEVGIDYSLKLSLSVSLNGSAEFPMGYFAIMFCGIIIEFTPSFVIECEGTLETSGTLSGSVGLSASLQEGIKNTSKSPTFKAEVKAEITIFIGLSLCPKVKVLHNVITGSLDARLGAEIKATLNIETENDNSVAHDCTYCVAGTITAKLSLTFELKFLNSNRLRLNFKLLNHTFKLFDFYWSLDHMKFGFTTCPYKKYLSTIVVKDACKNPIKDAKITFLDNLYITDEQGIAKVYLSCGNYDITATKDNYSLMRRVEVTDRAVTSVFYLEMNMDIASNDIISIVAGRYRTAAVSRDGTLYIWGKSEFGGTGHLPVKINNNNNGIPEHSVKQVILQDEYLYSEGEYSAVITKDGSLYTWGNNAQGRLGNGTAKDSYNPVKVLDNVKQACLSQQHAAAVTTNGCLYIWGSNSSSQLGNGVNSNSYYPIKIMDNVKQVSLSAKNSAAVTVDGGLYIWGDNRYGQLGNGTTSNSDKPIKIMENVKSVSLNGSSCAAITNDGCLYTWGYNGNCNLGDGTTSNANCPIKIMENVASFNFGGDRSAVITNDNSLYMWGPNHWGKIDKNQPKYIYSPVKVADNIRYIALGSSHNTAITKDKALLTWGADFDGQLGEGGWTNVAQSAAGYCFTVLLTTDGKVFACGKNNYYCVGQKNLNFSYISFAEVNIPQSIANKTNSVKTTASNSTLTDAVGVGTKRTITFYGYKSGEKYNFYSLKNREDGILSNNLLYISQVIADENGTVRITYTGTDVCNNPVEFLTSSESVDINRVTVESPEYSLQDSELCCTPVVKDGEYELCEGIDYMLGGITHTANPGEYTVTIIGKGRYKGSVLKTFSVHSVDIKETTISVTSDNPTFDGTAKEPKVSIMYRGLVLVENVDYSVTYRNNINAGTAYVDIDGIGNYIGSKTFSFNIKPICLDDSCVSPSVVDYQSYNSETLVPEIKVIFDGKELIKGIDYEVDCYSDEIYGYVSVYAYGIGNYNGRMRVNIRGDIDKDNYVNGRDLVFLQNYLDSTPEEREEMWFSVEAADINSDGKINESDVESLREFLKTHRVSEDINSENIEYDTRIKKVSLSADETAVGSIISVPIYIDNEQSFSYLRLSFNYDESKLSFINAENGEISNSFYSNNKDIVFWNTDSDISGSGKLVTLKFKILEESDSYDIQYKCSECFNSNLNYIESDLSTEEVLIYKIGDTNLDGTIDIRDVTAIQRHLAEFETLDENGLALADTNGDNYIDIADATHLQMYLAEYIIVLGKQTA